MLYTAVFNVLNPSLNTSMNSILVTQAHLLEICQGLIQGIFLTLFSYLVCSKHEFAAFVMYRKYMVLVFDVLKLVTNIYNNNVL